MKNAIRKAKTSGRGVKEARPGYTATMTIRSDALPNDLNQRSAQIVQRAKPRAAEQMPRMTADEAQVMYDAAATALRRALRHR